MKLGSLLPSSLQKSGPLCNGNKAELVMKLRNERDAILFEGASSQALLAYRKNNSKLSHYCDTISSYLLGAVAHAIIKKVCPKGLVTAYDLSAFAVALLVIGHDIHTDEKECRELDEKEKQSKDRLDIFNAMIRLAEEHHAQ